jgi:hypothetical protein
LWIFKVVRVWLRCGQIEEMINDKHLLIVPSGALTQLPFQVLIANDPDPTLSGTDAFRHAAWLVRSHPLTVLPSVSSLKALRRLAKPSAAMKPMIGFGNPLLDGDQSDPRYGAYDKRLAQLARVRQRCVETTVERVNAPGEAPG